VSAESEPRSKNIFRAAHDKDFFKLGNATVQNLELSWAARGLLAYLLLLPEDWTVHLRDLFKRSPTKRSGTESAVNELIRAGHIVKLKGDDHRRETKYIVFEDPVEGQRLCRNPAQ
jgi:DNA-binding MarR family transcriptional regulator